MRWFPVSLLALTGCQLVFDLGPRDAAPRDAAIDADLRSQPCQLAGAKLCLAFEDDLTDLETIDESGQGNDAALVDVSSAMRKGHQAVALGATSKISLLNVNTLNFPGPLSFDGFFRWTGDMTEFVHAVVDNVSAYGITMNTLGQYACTFVFDPVDQQPGFAFLLAGGIVIDLWHHVACVFDPEAGAFMYFDGIETRRDVTVAGRSVVTTAGGRLHVGQIDNNTNRMIGDIDDIRIFDRVLTPEEILDTVNAE